MKDTVGIDLAEIVKSGTYDAKVNRNIHISADSEEGKEAVEAAVAAAIAREAGGAVNT